MKQLIVLIILAIGATLLANNNEYVEIPSSSIRMRVIAASDDKEDQAEKIEIKSVVEKFLYSIIEKSDDEVEIATKIEDNKQALDEVIQKTIEEKDMNVDFKSTFGENYFPEKEFKGLVYKAGNYKSLVVELGEAKGENWWCVLYPPLCLVDENLEDYEYHSLIKDILAKYN